MFAAHQGAAAHTGVGFAWDNENRLLPLQCLIMVELCHWLFKNFFFFIYQETPGKDLQDHLGLQASQASICLSAAVTVGEADPVFTYRLWFFSGYGRPGPKGDKGDPGFISGSGGMLWLWWSKLVFHLALGFIHN